MSLSYKEVADILKIIDASACEEVILELENTRLVVRRGAGSESAASPPSTTQSSAAPAQQSPSQPAPDKSAPETVAPHDSDDRITVKSPMTGTFYSRPSPDEAPFVSEGAKVVPGDPLCLIEVMKLYTTIEATAEGIIHSILVEDGKLVEFDQPLFIIENHGE